MAENIKTLRHYSAPCHVCGGKGQLPNDLYEICGGPLYVASLRCRECKWYGVCSQGEQRECSVCNGNGTVHLYCEVEPTLEIIEIKIPAEPPGVRRLTELVENSNREE
jgi:hypothetical protein